MFDGIQTKREQDQVNHVRPRFLFKLKTQDLVRSRLNLENSWISTVKFNLQFSNFNCKVEFLTLTFNLEP